MSPRHVASVACGFVMGVAITAACTNLSAIRGPQQSVAAVVHERPILTSEVAQEAKGGLCRAIDAARTAWLESLEFVIARRLLQEEAVRTDQSVSALLAKEVAGKLTPVPDHQVLQAAVLRAATEPPPGWLIEQVRQELEVQALQSLRANYLATLEKRHGVSRSSDWSREADSALDLCKPGQVEIDELAPPAASHAAIGANADRGGLEAPKQGRTRSDERRRPAAWAAPHPEETSAAVEHGAEGQAGSAFGNPPTPGKYDRTSKPA